MINRNGHCVLQIAPTGNTGKAYLGINFFQNYYGIFDMENRRVGFAESIYSELSAEDSAAHNQQILLNMSSYEELEYFFESAGLDHGPEIVVVILLLCSIVLGAIAAEFLLKKSEDTESKQARQALSVVLNEGKTQQELEAEDQMFEVPLNDDARPAYSPAALQQQLAQSKHPVRALKEDEEEEYTFDVEL